ncbi:MAG: hypothetical protein JW874_08925 [Spirochaetales bacterium]|nr:hypothetical protein [Spirochaetales bacterium]
MKKSALAVLLALLLLFPVHTQESDSEPLFVLYSGDGEALSDADIAGKLVLLFYELKDDKEINRALKNKLKEYEDQILARHPDGLVLGIGDCTSACWPFKNLWKKGLSKASREQKVTIYGDWDGKIADIYNLDRKKPNFLIISEDGSVVYRKSGFIGEEQISVILGFLLE